MLHGTQDEESPTAEDGQSTYFLAVNRNTRSIALDLSTSEGQISARTPTPPRDVVVETSTVPRMDTVT